MSAKSLIPLAPPSGDGASDACSVESPRPVPEPLLVAAPEAARLVDVGVATWHRMVAAGRTPSPVRLSRGCVRWRLTELREWVAAGCPGRKEWDARLSTQQSGRPR